MGYKDTLRHFYPEARGLYTYWSVRAGNRGPNKGLRIDYFVASEGLMVENKEGVRVHDSFTMPDATNCSDHCPIGVVLTNP